MAPELSRVTELARSYRVVPVFLELVADSLTPVGAFRSVAGDGDAFLLESVERGERWSRFSFVGRSPVATLVARGSSVGVRGELPVSVPDDRGILEALRAVVGELHAPRVPGLPPLYSGLVGYLGYDVVREIERLGAPPPDDLGLPDAVMSLIGEVVAFDHWRQRVVLVDNLVLPAGGPPDDIEKLYERARSRLGRLRRDLERAVPEPLSEPPPEGEGVAAGVTRVVPAARYLAGVEVAKEHIRAGDAFQIVLSQRFDVELGCDPFDVYRMLRQVNPSPYMFFLRQGGVTVVGASPEPMVRLRDGRVVIRPIAGTRPRGRTEPEDRRLEAELVEHPKEVAEHVMLLDLARNDIGRVVAFGTEQVDEVMTVERYSHVMHLTSEVSGQLVAGKGPVDVLGATLPAGTVSGAPKVRAMQIIDELESSKRGPYAGTVGYIGLSGDLDTAIAIRTMVVSEEGRASVQAGAGIVVDSDPVAEDAECRAKAAAVLSAIAGARKLTASRPVVKEGA